MATVHIAWWNVENLFDEEHAQRDPELQQRLQKELVGWTVATRDRKLDQLAIIVKLMFGGAGPDLLGLAEVENENVVQLLANRLTIPGRQYKVLTHPSPDARGIDVSFIYDNAVLTPGTPGYQVVTKRRATRDIFWAPMTEHTTGKQFIPFGNHWPSRSGGQCETEPLRMFTGEVLGYVLEKIPFSTQGATPLPFVAMGDLNDEPFDHSV